MKRPPPPSTTGSPGPRRPELTLQQVLDTANRIEARKRERISHLSGMGRFRKWGKA